MSFAINLEEVACVVCGGVEVELMQHVRDSQFVNISCMTFPVVRCKNCGLRYLNLRPDRSSIHWFYPEQYRDRQVYRVRGSQATSLQGKIRNYVRRIQERRILGEKIKRVESLREGGLRILDVGTGPGHFLAAMQTRGHTVFGVEINSEMATFARDAFGLVLHADDLLSAPFAEESFDVVTYWEVVEHIHELDAYLKKTYDLLKKGGFIIVSTPNGTSVADWLALRINRSAQDYPRHLYSFDARTLSRLLARFDFTTICVDYHTRLNGPRLGFLVNGLIYSLSKRKVGEIVAHTLFLTSRISFYFLDFVFSLISRSSGLVLVGRKLLAVPHSSPSA